MANSTLSRAIVNTAFKSLSVLAIAVAATPLASPCKARPWSLHYILVAFWLIVEPSIAKAVATVFSYCVVPLEF